MAAITTGPFLAVCVVLAVAGLGKIRDPRPSATAVRAASLPASPSMVRALGVAEVAIAVAGAALGGPFAAAVAVVYLALGAVALALVRRAPPTPCGCLGTSAAPATSLHVGVDLAAAAVAVAAAVSASRPLDAVADQPLGGAPFVVLVLCAARLVALVLDALGDLQVAMREGRA
jgi:hypothetical protein